ARNEPVDDVKCRTAVVVVELVVEPPAAADERRKERGTGMRRDVAGAELAEDALSGRKPVGPDLHAPVDRRDAVGGSAIVPIAEERADIRFAADIPDRSRDAEPRAAIARQRRVVVDNHGADRV